MRRTWTAMLFAMTLTVPLAARAAGVPPGETVAEHLAQAQRYRDEARQYRADAAEQRQLAADYRKRVPGPAKGNIENPWAKKMDEQRFALASDADGLAREADKAADYHAFRAQELEGK